ncbi:MAG: hypothetical protein A3H98_07730 [Bacteroidetes bacterium RIFCSPLOWO2_02_FULL_36_8]|nr:MAG: hypothetical protein A3H98_07730 [Bacteroidetes bacterium RIFCSPLOWO2_02_FULL_36_8]OFY69856.1 MAG: hypothetical protein A3G23_07420 [Bacteroidetes bacterium RIFCSPLOWO2_12_FULL_37_12]
MFQETKEMFRETDRKHQETEKMFQETDRKFQETDRKHQETEKMFQETDRQFKETDKKLNKLENLFTGQWGKLIESLVEGDLVNLLKKWGINVQRTFTRIKFVYDNQKGEIDILAVNGTEVVVVEVKTTLVPEDVEDFIKKLNDFKKIFTEYKDKKVLGAVAYLRTDSNAGLRVERMGLFVIRATGNSASIINQKGFSPKVFEVVF